MYSTLLAILFITLNSVFGGFEISDYDKSIPIGYNYTRVQAVDEELILHYEFNGNSLEFIKLLSNGYNPADISFGYQFGGFWADATQNNTIYYTNGSFVWKHPKEKLFGLGECDSSKQNTAGYLCNPTLLTKDYSTGSFIVVSGENNQVVTIFYNDSSYKRSSFSASHNLTQLAVDMEGNIYVLDGPFGNIWKGSTHGPLSFAPFYAFINWTSSQTTYWGPSINLLSFAVDEYSNIFVGILAQKPGDKHPRLGIVVFGPFNLQSKLLSIIDISPTSIITLLDSFSVYGSTFANIDQKYSEFGTSTYGSGNLGCDALTYGNNCTLDCPCNRDGGRCSRGGICLCNLGYSGNLCQILTQFNDTVELIADLPGELMFILIHPRTIPDIGTQVELISVDIEGNSEVWLIGDGSPPVQSSNPYQEYINEIHSYNPKNFLSSIAFSPNRTASYSSLDYPDFWATMSYTSDQDSGTGMLYHIHNGTILSLNLTNYGGYFVISLAFDDRSFSKDVLYVGIIGEEENGLSKAILAIDPISHQLLYSLYVNMSRYYNFDSLSNVAVDENGNVFAVDLRRVYGWKRTNNDFEFFWLTESDILEHPTWETNYLSEQNSIVASDSILYVTASYGKAIYKLYYSVNSTELTEYTRRWGGEVYTSSTEVQEFDGPRALALNSGYLYFGHEMYTISRIDAVRQCEPDHYGIACNQCECLYNSRCNDTVEGDGACICFIGYTGPNCTECSPGFSLTSKKLCVKCPEGTYSSDGVTCYPCTSPNSVVNSDQTGCQCTFGYYGYEKNSSNSENSTYEIDCSQCDEGLVCDDGNIHVSLGYLQSKLVITNAYSCFNSDACSNNTCTDGYTGPLCAVCQDGYRDSGNFACEECPNKTGKKKEESWLIIGSLLATFFVTFKLYIELRKDQGVDYIKNWKESLFRVAKGIIHRKVAPEKSADVELHEVEGNEKGEEAEEEEDEDELETEDEIQAAVEKNLLTIGNLKIFVGFIQVFTNIKRNFAIKWPAEVLRIMSWFSFINLDVFSLSSTECFQTITFYDRLLLLTIAPLVLLLTVPFIFYGVLILLYKIETKTWPNAESKKLIVILIIRYIFVFLFLIYTGVSLQVLETFKFVYVDGTPYLVADMSVQSNTTEWHKYSIFAGFMIAVYPLGIPLASAVILIYYRNRLAEKDILAKYGALYSEYEFATKPSEIKDPLELRRLRVTALWEIWDIFRRLLLTGLLVFVNPGTISQVAVACFICLLSLTLHVWFKPYRSRTTDYYQMASLIALSLNFFLGLLIMAHQEAPLSSKKDPYNEGLMTGMVIFVNAIVFIIGASLIIVATFRTIIGYQKVAKEASLKLDIKLPKINTTNKSL